MGERRGVRPGTPRRFARWTAEEDDLLREEYGKSSLAALAKRLGRTYGAVATRATQLFRLRATENVPGKRTIYQAARELHVDPRRLYDWLERRGKTGKSGDFWKPQRGGKFLYVSDEQMERLREIFPPLEFPAISQAEVERILGYSRSHILRLAERGYLRAVKRGTKLCYSERDVRAIAAWLRRTGKDTVDWEEFVASPEARWIAGRDEGGEG